MCPDSANEHTIRIEWNLRKSKRLKLTYHQQRQKQMDRERERALEEKNCKKGTV